MKYEDALQEWGARKIETANWALTEKIDRSTVKVEMEFDEGYACCGGRDPDCYCSFAESPSANVSITGRTSASSRKVYSAEIDHYSFDFATVLREIVEASGGAVTE